jgi:hypothetical protein
MILKEKKKTVLPLGFELTIICLKTFHAPRVSVAIFGTKIVTYGHLLLELSKIK